MKIVKSLCLLLVLSFISPNMSAQQLSIKPQNTTEIGDNNSSKFPVMKGVVNDYGKVFTASEIKELTTIIQDFTVMSNKRIAILTVTSIGEYKGMREYATGLKNDWKIGYDSDHNSLTIALCVPCRGVGIATGVNSEPSLTDEVCKNAIAKTMVPEFTAGNYYAGLKKGLLELMENWK